MTDWRDDPTERDRELANDRAADDNWLQTHEEITQRSFKIADLDRKIENMKRSQERSEAFDSLLARKNRIYDKIDTAQHIASDHKSEWRVDLIRLMLSEKAASDDIRKLLAKVEAYRQTEKPAAETSLLDGLFTPKAAQSFNRPFSILDTIQIPHPRADRKRPLLPPLEPPAATPADLWLQSLPQQKEKKKAAEAESEIQEIISELRTLQNLHLRYLYLKAG